MIINNDISFEEFVSIVDQAYDEILIYDNNYNIVYINKACERHYGISQEDMINFSFYDFSDEYWSTSVLPYVYRTKKAVQQKQETVLGAKLLTIAVPIFDENNEVKYVVMSVRDDTLDETTQTHKLLEDVIPTNMKNVEKRVIFNSEKMKKLIGLVNEITNLDCPILITGESGVGKTLIGKYIHENSERKEKPFVHINCAAISNTLFESELYGYEKGSFTGARSNGKKGLATQAHGGTLFLDEISEIPYEMQAKLLQFIQEKKFYPVGSLKPVEVDVRIITATNRNLEQMVEMGTFRQDLYYRLNVFEIDIPSIRDRKEDILLICDYFLNIYCHKYNKTHRLSKEVKEIFMNYSWKGNVREISHIIERLVVVTKEVVIKPINLPKHLYELTVNSKHNNGIDELIKEGQTLKEILENYEGEIIKKIYNECKSTRKLGEKLGISQTKASKLYRKYVKNEFD
ncbi:MAG: sigma 54-interacting transcriptional regulator [Tepidibacter sp.]|jgi:TyrR family helix-turn-helix protein/PAS domain S-box-containing protein|uniref:sigma-54 interaction domain-containing protein n=1 Tax=Tepidibacter sp. TaxID=2529387 RepID=UPI0025FCB2FA|nr:sigma 54-interacting transcriptional regulator [Tepidibacter sp.]MCT4509588.1 sigma 54-interacting transcriptional regulator [Tepidibacter sp.]